MNSILSSSQITLLDVFKKYIPQCDKNNHITLHFGEVQSSEYTTIQLPTESAIVNEIKTNLQSSKYFKSSILNGWRIYSDGLVFEQNSRTGYFNKQRRVVIHSSNNNKCIFLYERIEENDGIIPTIIKPNMEEQFERIVYVSNESGLNEMEWWIEHSFLSNKTKLSCVLKKPVQEQKLLKHLQSFGLGF